MIQDVSILARLIDFVFNIAYFALLARVILSWIPHDPFHPAVTVINQLSDPILRPLQRLLPPLAGFDLSPMVAFLVMEVLRSTLISLLF